MYLGRCEKKTADADLYFAVWSVRCVPAFVLSGMFHLQYTVGNASGSVYDAGQLAQPRKNRNGRRDSSGGDRRISGRTGESEAAFYRAYICSSLVFDAFVPWKEKWKRKDCIRSVFADFLSYDADRTADMIKRKVSGSFTVEAALVLPVVLICMLLILNQGFEMYRELAETADKQQMWEEFVPSDYFRKLELLDEVTG